ncbi:MAG TPA: sterol desaturase family protein, partial [Xanthomonadaceae bacterium]|nr:sterol desaturase family protein [Xanthomonadaceae bacterium]
DRPLEPIAGDRLSMKWFDAWLVSLERMSATRANSVASLTLDIATPIVLLAAGSWLGDVRAVPALLVVMAGLLLFTLVEYCFHRWIFHGSRSLEAFRQGHWNHHVDPLCVAALPFFLPPALILILVGLFDLAMPLGYAVLLAGAIACGYTCYDLSHYIIHNRRFRHPLGRRWAASHHIHHHHPDRNFGVTTPLWDYALGTRHVSASRRLGKP